MASVQHVNSFFTGSTIKCIVYEPAAYIVLKLEILKMTFLNFNGTSLRKVSSYYLGHQRIIIWTLVKITGMKTDMFLCIPIIVYFGWHFQTFICPWSIVYYQYRGDFLVILKRMNILTLVQEYLKKCFFDTTYIYIDKFSMLKFLTIQ